MSKWFYVNILIFIFILWKLFTSSFYSYTLLGTLGMFFILYNWTRQAMFATIRSQISRERKVKFANLSKKLQFVHKWTGTAAFIFIFFHLLVIMQYFPFQVSNAKMLTGLFAFIALIGTVTFGWIRHIRTTVYRRYIHWTFAYLLFFLACIHILL